MVDPLAAIFPVQRVGTGSWRVQSKTRYGVAYSVAEHRDTANGGAYLRCECAGWARSIRNGGCYHVKAILALEHWAVLPGTVRIDELGTLPDPITMHVATTSATGTEDDLAAAARLMGWAL